MNKSRIGLGIAGVAVLMLSLFGFSAAANAQTGCETYVPSCALTLDKIVVGQGGSVTATARGYTPGATVGFVVNSIPFDAGSSTADGSGTVVHSFVIPSDFPLGEHTVVATGTGANGDTLVLSASLTVVAPGTEGTGTGGTGSLPRTGSDSADLLRAGALLVAAGGAVVLITRKRSAKAGV